MDRYEYSLPPEDPEVQFSLDQPRFCWVCKESICQGVLVVFRRPDTRLVRHSSCTPYPVKRKVLLAPTEEEARQIPRKAWPKRRRGRLSSDS